MLDITYDTSDPEIVLVRIRCEECNKGGELPLFPEDLTRIRREGKFERLFAAAIAADIREEPTLGCSHFAEWIASNRE